MAVTYANGQIINRASWTEYYVEITLDSAYATGGETLNASDFGMTVIQSITPQSAEGFVVEPARSSDSVWTLKLYAWSNTTNTAIEMASGVDRSGITIPVVVRGR